MTYQEFMNYLAQMPSFSPQQIQAGKDPFNLDNITTLLTLLGNPHEKLKYIHIAGTNGKGSTSAFLNQILIESGYKVGIFTSPFVERFTEQIRINNQEIANENLARIATKVCEMVEQMKSKGMSLPSEFEIICSIAFLYFLEECCDIVILETGLGGRLDATNVIPAPLLAMITSISLDHTQVLGNTLEQIAMEKAGIIKPGCEVLLYPQCAEVEKVFEITCASQNVILHKAFLPQEAKHYDLSGQTFDLHSDHDSWSFDNLSITLLGHYQIHNASMAVNAAMLLRRKGYNISDKQIYLGLEHTKWIGRFELIRKNPAIIIDGSHNEDGVTMLCESLRRYFPEKKFFFITGVLADKAYDKMMLPIIPLAKKFFTITPPSPRALSSDKLATFLTSHSAESMPCESIKNAIQACLEEASKDDVICIFGSLYFLGEVRHLLLPENK